MDEIAKTEARNYLSAAGFFLIGAEFLLNVLLYSSGLPETFPNVDLISGAGLLIISALLVILRKRDMMAMVFTMIGLTILFSGFVTFGIWYVVATGFIFLTVLVTLASKDKQKWLLSIIPLLGFAMYLILSFYDFNVIKYGTGFYCFMIIGLLIAGISLYYALACASERFSLPGKKLLTADEETDFKASGSVLGYMLFGLIVSSWALFNIFGESFGFTFKSLQTLELLCAALMILVSILLFAVGKMRFTPVMFLLIALTTLLGNYSTGEMAIGLGALFLFIGLFAVLRKESRILPGIMLVLYSVAFFIMGSVGFGVPTFALGSIEIVVAAISVYLAFAVYSQKKLPMF